ncbi:unnamed protein product, partial [Timema podura]|nr:unnamed protein product [Timema podura]
FVLSGAGEGAYHGKSLGKLKTLHHGVSGEVFAVDARTLHIRDFSYDGEGPVTLVVIPDFHYELVQIQYLLPPTCHYPTNHGTVSFSTAAYFYVGNSKAPSQGGLRLSDEKGS